MPWHYKFFIWLGTRICGFPYIDVYSPPTEHGEPMVRAVTFALDKKYIEKIMEIEI